MQRKARLSLRVWTLCRCPWSPRFVPLLLNHTPGSLEFTAHEEPRALLTTVAVKKPHLPHPALPIYFFQIEVLSWMVATGMCCRLFHLHADPLARLHFNTPTPCLGHGCRDQSCFSSLDVQGNTVSLGSCTDLTFCRQHSQI